MNFTIINTIILLGTIQGFIFAIVVLFSKKYRATSSYLLVALILAASYNNLQYYVTDIGLMTINRVYQTIYLPLAALVPAVIYFYVFTLINPTYKVSGSRRVLFLPFILFFAIVTYFKIGTFFDFLTEGQLAIIYAIPPLHEIVSFLFLFTVLIVALRKIQITKKNVNEYHRSRIEPKLSWLFWIVLLLFGINLVYGFTIFKMLSNTNETTTFYAVWVANSLLVYILGHVGIYKYGVQQERKKLRSFSINRSSFSITEKNKNEHIVALEKMMHEEKIYLNPTTTLDTIAERLQLSKTHVSRLINTEMRQSFSDYLNKLRVEEAKQYLQNPDFSGYTLVAIGLEAGFNSKTTFNSAFKKHTAMTPSEFRRSNR